MALGPERANLNFDILHKDFDSILRKISKFWMSAIRLVRGGWTATRKASWITSF